MMFSPLLALGEKRSPALQVKLGRLTSVSCRNLAQLSLDLDQGRRLCDMKLEI